MVVAVVVAVVVMAAVKVSRYLSGSGGGGGSGGTQHALDHVNKTTTYCRRTKKGISALRLHALSGAQDMAIHAGRHGRFARVR